MTRQHDYLPEQVSTGPAPTHLRGAAALRDRVLNLQALMGVAVYLACAWPLLRFYLVNRPPESWQVDLEVYRDGAISVLQGRDLYSWLTGSPQWLPFTYPPIAALAALPLSLVSFRTAGWLWSVLQLALLWFSVGLAFRPFLTRLGHRLPLGQGILSGILVWTLPVAEGFRFGQVNAVIVALCLVDIARPGTESRPRGLLIGIAAAIKLTPGVFWIHWAAAGRWRPLAVSVATTISITALMFLLMPNASVSYWTDALLDPGRLGPNAGTSNQSLRGAMLRSWPGGASPAGPGPYFPIAWLTAAAVVAALGFIASRALEARGERVAVVATVGMLAVLLSPVSWVHHVHWGVVAVGALLGDGRRPARVTAAALTLVLLLCRLPWWGFALLADGTAPRWLGRAMQSGLTILAALVIIGLWTLVARAPLRNPGHDASRTSRATDPVSSHENSDP